MGTLVENVFRWLFSWIDRAIVLMLNAVYSLLMKLATLNIVNMDTIKSFGTRIGLILGIFMLFNLAINLLTYLVSPEKFSDSKQGGMKIFWNAIVSIVLLGTVNIIFEHAYKLQYAVLEKQIIPQIIFGTKAQNPTEKVEIAYYVYSSMININPAYDEDGICETIYLTGEISRDCRELLKETLDSGYYQFERAVEHKDASKLLTADNITARSGDEYVFDYMFIFATIIGVITTLIMFNFCFDIAKRTVKLYFYQLIAPIPIIANMIPGKGSETFKKWVKSVVSTYFDIFIRLVALFFAIFVISTVYGSLGDIFEHHKILGVFILLGALMFAKEIPQLIQDLTGLKLDGGFTINPLKKISEAPLAAGLVGYAGGRLGGAVSNFWGASVQNKNVRKQLAAEGLTVGTKAYNDRFKELHGNTLGGYAASVIAGSHSAGIRSLWTGVTGGGKKSLGQVMSQGITGAAKARNQRDAGFNIRSKFVDSATDIAQIKNDYGTTDKLKGQVKELQRQAENEQRNENMLSDLLRQRINEMENAKKGTMNGLLEFFNNDAVMKPDGSFDHYKVKDYKDYTNTIGKSEYIKAGRGTESQWNALNDAQRQTEMNYLSYLDKVLDSQEFESINDVYNNRNHADERQKQLNKQIKSIQENMTKKDGNK